MTHTEKIGKYHVVALIGEGGMGRVYEATDPVIGRRVAIKVISLEVNTEEVRARFFREAQAAGRLSHPNIITIHDIGVTDDSPHIVMEFLEGSDLSRQIQGGALSLDRKMKIMVDVCDGLAHAHDSGIVHRDIKPANIFITVQGAVKIVDFGLARGAVSDVTRTGSILGTPSYMAPEQIRGEPIDQRVDIFAAGVVLYELLSGIKPFAGDSIEATIYKVLQLEPPALDTLGGGLPPHVSTIAGRALAKDKSERYQTARELRDALLGLGRSYNEATIPIGAATLPIQVVSRAPDQARRSAAAAAWLPAGAVVLAIVAGLGGFVLFNRGHTEQETVAASVSITASDPKPPAAKDEPPASMSSPAKADEPATRPPGAEEIRPAVATSTASRAPVLKATRDPVKPDISAGPPPSALPSSTAAGGRSESGAIDEAGARAAIQRLLADYRGALELRDFAALRKIWPDLGGSQEDAIRNEFARARRISVALDGVQTSLAGSMATVSCRRNYTVTTAEGQKLDSASQMTMMLSGRDGSWVIDSIRFEGIR